MSHKINSRIKTKLRINDAVCVICGKDKGKEGKILSIDAHRNVASVSGINMVKKAMRRKRQEDKGGIVDIERPIHLSNMQIISKGKKSRLCYDLASEKGGAKRRKAVRTGEVL